MDTRVFMLMNASWNFGVWRTRSIDSISSNVCHQHHHQHPSIIIINDIIVIINNVIISIFHHPSIKSQGQAGKGTRRTHWVPQTCRESEPT